MVYLAIRCRGSSPEMNMLAYGVIMSQAARDYSPDKWLQYDRKFRELAGARKDAQWNEINVGLWNRCFVGCSSSERSCNECLQSGHSSWDCPTARPKKGRGPWKTHHRATGSVCVMHSIIKASVTKGKSAASYTSASHVVRSTLR